jgi:ADP-dependent NAD(P)H-hydrate dehydratase
MSRSSLSELINERFLRRWPLPPVDPGGNKETRGAVLVVGGAPQMPGAAILSATAALRAGAGKLQIATCRSVASLVAAHVPEALVVGLPQTRKGGIALSAAREIERSSASASAILIGPGMVDPAAVARLVANLLSRLKGKPLVLDAEALACASLDPAAFAATKADVAVTPHSREMAQMLKVQLSQVERNPAATALRAAKVLQGVVVLKGAETFIAAPSGRLLCNRDAGNAGLGTSGSGDTLSGVVAGVAARGAPLLQAAAWGVFLHARAGDVLARKLGPVGYLARELLAEIPREMARLSRRR